MSESAILKELRENWDYARTAWQDTYTEAEKDMRYQTEGPWDKDEKDARKGRVTLSLDELSQYINQICNEFRMKPRGVKVSPRGDGANDQTAQIRAGIIREIEYQSQAQQAYVSCGESMVERSFGFFKLVTEFEPGSFRRMIRVVAVPNPHVIYIDPDFKKPDASDAEFGFEVDRMTERQFRKKFPKADTTSFTDEHVAAAPLWITNGDGGKQIQVVKYWKLTQKPNPLYLLENGREVDTAKTPGLQVVDIEKSAVDVGDGRTFEAKKALMLDGVLMRVIDERQDNQGEVTEYIANGIEILEETPSDFTEIPLIPMFGKVKWVAHGGTSKRIIMSAPRLARDAYKGYCYALSAAVERVGMDPKTPYEGYEGQFATQTFASGNDINKLPQQYAEFKAKTEETGEAILPLPRRNLTDPQINQYQVLAEALRRAIQAAMGGSPLPVSAQRQNQKSGVALEKIEASSDQGNFHFIDNFDRALERAGRMMDDALDRVYDTPREVGARDESGESKIVPINQLDDQGNPVGFHTKTGDHGVTISTGPSSQSEREEADKFTEQLMQRPELLGPSGPKILALLVKLRNLGPIGDKIADLLDPQQGDAASSAIAAAQQQIQALQGEIEDLKRGDAIKKYTVDEQEKTKRVLGLTKVDQQDAETALEKMLGILDQHTQRFHEMQQQIAEHGHQREMAAQAAAQPEEEKSAA